MNKLYKLLLATIAMVGIFVVFSGSSASAAPLQYKVDITSSDGNRSLCPGGVPVDFKAGVSSANFNTGTGQLSYNVDLSWRTCSGSTRAYAIYSTNGAGGVCPNSGTYAADAGSYAYDCLKYIGNPAYQGPGNGLSCPAWGGGSGEYTNEWCVNTGFNAIRKVANEPPTSTTNESIAMSRFVPGDWNENKKNNGSHTFVAGSVCQYYKTGANWDTDNRNRCMTITVRVEWWNPPIEGNVETMNCTFDGKNPATANQADNTGRIKGWAYDSYDKNYKMEIIIRAGQTAAGGGDNTINPRVSVTKADGPRPGESYAGTSINGHGFDITTLNQQGNVSIRDYILEKGFDTPTGRSLYFTVSARAEDGRTRSFARTQITCPGLNGNLELANCTFTPSGLPSGSSATGVLQGWAVDQGNAANNQIQIIVRAGKYASGSRAQGDDTHNPRVSEGTYANKTVSPRTGEFADGIPITGHEYQITNLNLKENKSIREYVIENGGELYFSVFARDAGRTRLLGSRVKITCSPACTITMAVAGRPAEDTTPEPGQTVTVTATYPNGFPTSTQAVFNVVNGHRLQEEIPASEPPLVSIPGGVMVRNLSPPARTASTTFSIPSTGKYSVRVSFTTYPTRNAYCAEPFEVASKPYLRTYGNDVAVGGKFRDNQNPDDNCSIESLPNDKAGILAFANRSPWSGASSQLASFALGEIYEFNSAGNQAATGVASEPPKGLTIGNYYEPAAEYGGRGGQYRCIPDYFDITSSTFSSGPSVSGNVNVGRSGYYKPNSGVANITGTVTGRYVVVVDGDAYIGSNIAYDNQSSFTAGTARSLYLIVKGDIYIGPGVTSLSGVYIAQPKNEDGSGGGGTIYTCANNRSFVPKADLDTTCANQLVVNGAFAAQDVKFLRTRGTLRSATANEDAGSANIAEVFKSGGALYMAAPAELQKPVSGSRTYDSITSLPPVL